MTDLRIKRIYEPADPADGYRVLVDRLWPRGLSRDRAELDDWLRGVAPSPSLRTWWGHDPARLDEFADRYRAELDDNPAVDGLLADLHRQRRVTLLYAARDPRINHATILRDYLLERAAAGLRLAGPAEPEGGDPACWLERVCPQCGAMIEGPDGTACWNCGWTGDAGSSEQEADG